MLSVVEIYEDVSKDTTNADQNGQLSYAMFSRLSRRAELRLLSWLTGSDSGERLPMPWANQKNKDWLSPLIKKFSTQAVNGFINRPSDYYEFDNFFRLGTSENGSCEEDENPDECNTPIELLDGSQYYERCRTHIEELKPSLNKPISKIVGNTFELMPKDLGSVTLEYIKMPVFGSITGKIDTTFNDEVPDTVVNYEWDERARPLLIWFIVDEYANNTREQAIKQFNAASSPKE